MKTIRISFWFLAIALLVGLLSIPATGSDKESSERKTTDDVLTQEVQQKLADHLELGNVQVAVDDRIATLRGTVESYRQRLEAEKVARSHSRIEGVRDEIAVQPTVRVSDDRLRQELANRLRYDRIGYGITFNHLELGVTNGIVTISGQVRDYPDKESALAIVADTAGVRGINDHVEVLPLSSFDDQLRIQAAKAIYEDPALRKYAIDPQAPIRIVVENGRISLYGVVNNAMDKQVAEMRALSVAGVFSVDNKLVVANDGVKAGDGAQREGQTSGRGSTSNSTSNR